MQIAFCIFCLLKSSWQFFFLHRESKAWTPSAVCTACKSSSSAKGDVALCLPTKRWDYKNQSFFSKFRKRISWFFFFQILGFCVCKLAVYWQQMESLKWYQTHTFSFLVFDINVVLLDRDLPDEYPRWPETIGRYVSWTFSIFLWHVFCQSEPRKVLFVYALSCNLQNWRVKVCYYSAFRNVFPKLCLILKEWFLTRFPPNFQERFLMSSASPEFVFWGPKIKQFCVKQV